MIWLTWLVKIRSRSRIVCVAGASSFGPGRFETAQGERDGPVAGLTGGAVANAPADLTVKNAMSCGLPLSNSVKSGLGQACGGTAFIPRDDIHLRPLGFRL